MLLEVGGNLRTMRARLFLVRKVTIHCNAGAVFELSATPSRGRTATMYLGPWTTVVGNATYSVVADKAVPFLWQARRSESVLVRSANSNVNGRTQTLSVQGEYWEMARLRQVKTAPDVVW